MAGFSLARKQCATNAASISNHGCDIAPFPRVFALALTVRPISALQSSLIAPLNTIIIASLLPGVIAARNSSVERLPVINVHTYTRTHRSRHISVAHGSSPAPHAAAFIGANCQSCRAQSGSILRGFSEETS